MDKKQLSEKVKKGNYTPEQLLNWIQCLPGSSGTHKPTKNKVGDVYMHPVFMHPYVLLEKKKDGIWICGLLTSDEKYEQILEPCISRFFISSFFTKTLFTLSSPIGAYCNVYDNNPHLKRVIKELKSIFA
jgi:hypothetical protein